MAHQIYELVLPAGEAWFVGVENGKIVSASCLKESEIDEEISINKLKPISFEADNQIYAIIKSFQKVLGINGDLHPITIKELQELNLIDGVLGLW